MTIPASSESIERRLERLERAQSRSRAAIAMLAVLALALVGWQFQPASRMLECEQLVLRNKEHRSRAELGLWADGSVVFRLNDREEKAHCLWMMVPDGSIALRLSDAKGNSRAELRLDANGEPSLVLAGADGRTRTRLGVLGENGSPALIVRDPKNEPRWQAP